MIDTAIRAYGAEPATLDGGFEYNNLRRVLESPQASLTASLAPKDGWRYVVAKRPREGYAVLQTRRAGQIWPLGGDSLYLLDARRDDGE